MSIRLAAFAAPVMTGLSIAAGLAAMLILGACSTEAGSVLTRPAAHTVAQVVKPAAIGGAVAARPVVNPRPFGNDPQPVAAWKVQTGSLPCKEGIKLDVQDAGNGQYRVSVSSPTANFTMQQVATKTTGVVRLEDVRGVGYLMQAATQTMVFNTKQEKRIATQCQSPAQKAYEEFVERKGGMSPLN